MSDSGLQAKDPIGRIDGTTVTIRPSLDAFRQRIRATPAWRWTASGALLPIAVAALYLAGGWLLAVTVAAFGVACAVLLPVLYFNVFFIRGDAFGITVRNQLGVRRFIPRSRIAALTVGRAWDGSLSRPDFAFIVGPDGRRLGRFYLHNWYPDDFSRLANALGLHLYGRPGRALDQFHSARAGEQVARLYGASLATGLIIGCGLPVLGIAAFGVALLLAHVGH